MVGNTYTATVVKNNNKTTTVNDNNSVLLSQEQSQHAAMEWEGNLDDYPMKTFVLSLSKKKDDKTKFLINPVVVGISTLLIWGLAITCMIAPSWSSEMLTGARASVTSMFTWFYVCTNPTYMCFIIFTAVRYGNIKLGPKESIPEFSDFEYFSMLFSAGIGVGLFFYGVSEPLSHQSGNYYAQTGYHTQDESDMFALNLTIFHWSITGWSQYLVVALCCGLSSFRFHLPMSLRSCFYILVGEYIWGWIGDCIDALSIVATVTGVCTSLGLGATQIAAGLERVGAIESNQDDQARQWVHVIEIWVITAFATCSVVSGLDAGIKYLSILGLALGMLLQCLVFYLDQTNFLLNLIVQEVGTYLSTSLLTLNFHTDAFASLSSGIGHASDGKSADEHWMNAWTIFYIGWWVSWSGFVGLFIARISKGRTIRSIIVHSYAIPLGYTILWFGVFGGVGLRQSRQALELQVLGNDVFGNSSHYLSDGSTYCYDVPQDTVLAPNGTIVFENELLGVTPVCGFNPLESDMAWFNVLYSYSYPLDFEYGFGPTLAWLSLVSLTIYFVTSSDSGSLVVDTLASNGYVHTHWSQRVYWAVTEGALASALLCSGGTDGLQAVQAASIITGLPFSFMLTFMCVSTYKMCQLAEFNDKQDDGTIPVTLKEHYHSKRTFQQPVFGGVFNLIEYSLMCCSQIHEERKKTMPFPTTQEIIQFGMALIVPCWSYHSIISIMNPKSTSRQSNSIMTCLYALTFYGWIILYGCTKISVGFRAFAVCVWMMNAILLATLRSSVRGMCGNIDGNLFWDFMTSMFVWPQVLCQLSIEMKHVTPTAHNNSHTNDYDNGNDNVNVQHAAENSFDDDTNNSGSNKIVGSNILHRRTASQVGASGLE